MVSVLFNATPGRSNLSPDHFKLKCQWERLKTWTQAGLKKNKRMHKHVKACDNQLLAHVKTNFWRIVKSHLTHVPLCKTWGNVSSGLLGKLCKTLPAPLISIGASSGGRTGTSSKLPCLATPCTGEAFTMRPGMLARLSTKAYNIMRGITFRWSCLTLFVASLPGIAGMMGHEPMPLSGMSPTSGNTFHKDDLRK